MLDLTQLSETSPISDLPNGHPQPILPEESAISNLEITQARLEGPKLAQSELENQEHINQSKTEAEIESILVAFSKKTISQNPSQPPLSLFSNNFTAKWGEVIQFIQRCSQSCFFYLEESINKIHKFVLVLEQAARNGYATVVKTLLGKAITAISDDNKNWALMFAARNGYIDVVNALLENAGAAILDTETALIVAVRNGHVDVVNTLLEKVGTAISGKSKGFALEIAARNGYIGVVNTLLEKAGTAIPDGYKYLALKQAVIFGKAAIVNTLLEKSGNDISPKDQKDVLKETIIRNRTQVIAAFTSYYQSLKAKYLETVKQRAYQTMIISTDCHVPIVLTTIMQQYDENGIPQPIFPEKFAIISSLEIAQARLEGQIQAQIELENQERINQSKTETEKTILAASTTEGPTGVLTLNYQITQVQPAEWHLESNWGTLQRIVAQFKSSHKQLPNDRESRRGLNQLETFLSNLQNFENYNGLRAIVFNEKDSIKNHFKNIMEFRDDEVNALFRKVAKLLSTIQEENEQPKTLTKYKGQ